MQYALRQRIFAIACGRMGDDDGSELDPSTERIVACVSGTQEAPDSVAFFRFFVDGDAEHLSRAWLRDAAKVETGADTGAKELRNGEVYASFGHGEDRRCSPSARTTACR